MNNVSALSLPSAFRNSQEVVAENARMEAEQNRVRKRWQRMQVTPLVPDLYINPSRTMPFDTFLPHPLYNLPSLYTTF